MESSCERPKLPGRLDDSLEGRLRRPLEDSLESRLGESLEGRLDDSTNMNHTAIHEVDESKDSENGNSMSDSQVRYANLC